MEELNFNVYNVLILAGIIHGFIFSLIIFLNKNLNSKTNYLLAFTILSLAFSNLQYWFIDTGIIPRYKYDNNSLLFIPFEFLMLPFFFLFVKSYLNKKINRLEYIYLFIPFLLSIVYLLVRNFLNDDLAIIKIFNLVVEYISIIFSITIIVLVFRLLIIYQKSHSKYSIHDVIIKTKWLKRILFLGILLCVLWGISLSIFKNLFNGGYYHLYPLWIGLSILIYWIGYSAILQKHLYQERKEIRKKISNKSHKKLLPINNKAKSATYLKIDGLIIDNKLHLDPSLSLKTLSKKLNLSEGYISQLINKNSNLSFNDYINSLRINDAKEMLTNDNYKNYTILAIGLESGFNSKSSFYAAFKKFTGQTPIEYKKGVRNL
ncbi:helix-turn-helix domain-containing protein [Flavivirga abyssicola]|uniref:helix-turn-helix domain-containing protein n=1 Tax=Flavivirga abyssicola TaxID=3063533 RepID=UPI0026E111EC|nr:helix-turn-helix domain-containing protein [Flavivirga sp. MEBiC07777]WVK13519.1 helix-turn-helix domain-containing protein [Flavivirga sp. MEBiC07777]